MIEPRDERWRVGSALISRVQLNHPGGAQGFRIDDEDGSSIAYLTDNELNPPGPGATSTAALAEFSRSVGLLIHDAQYIESDMPAKKGWGHSLVSEVLELGRSAEADTVALFHHEPERDDEALDRTGVSASDWLKEKQSATHVVVAREGLTVRVAPRSGH